MLIQNVSKVAFDTFHDLRRFPRYLTKIFPERRLKH